MRDDAASASEAGQQHELALRGSGGKFSLWLLLAGLLVNVAAAVLMRAHTTIGSVDADESEYWNIAGAFQTHGLSGIPSRRTLPFPLLLASLRWLLGDSYFPVQLAISALLAGMPVITYWVVRRHVGSEQAARCAAVLCLLWPPFVRYGASIYSDSIALSLFLGYLLVFPVSQARSLSKPVARAALQPLAGFAAIARWHAAAPARRRLQFVCAGALLGLCVQMKPLYLLYTPLAFVLAVSAESSIRRGLTAAVLLTAGCIVVLAPWSAYISAREGHFILLSANDGETLAGGLNPALLSMGDRGVFVTAGGRSTWVGPGKWVPMEQTGYLTARELELPYSQASALMAERARAWIKAHPGDVAYLSARKLLYMWGIYPFWNGASQSLLGNLPLLALLATAATGLWLCRAAWRPLALFWTLPILSSLVALISWGSWRFRMPADAGLIILAAVSWTAWYAARSKTRARVLQPASSTCN